LRTARQETPSMRFVPASIAACAAALLAFTSFAHAQVSPSPAARVIVKLKSGSSTLRKALAAKAGTETVVAQELGDRIGVPLTAGIGVSDTMQVVHASGLTSSALAAQLARDPDVEFAVPDRRRHAYLVPNDPLYPDGLPGNGPAAGQWYLRPPAGAVQAGINVEPAWDITMGSPGVVVAVLDTGIRFDHPDLLTVASGGNILPGYDMVSDIGTANDGDGRDPDASDPGNWVTAIEANDRSSEFYHCTVQDPSTGRYIAENSSWHGTMTSSLIGALTNNGIGMASVSPNARILPVRVLGKCGGFDSDILAGMRWAAGLDVPRLPPNINRARVINMSLGAEGPCDLSYQSVVDDIIAAGTTLVIAAGNTAGHMAQSPANCRGVIAVAALRHVGNKVGFSDLGPAVAISAPGGNCVNTEANSACLYPILAAVNTGSTTPASSSYTDSYKISVGTSFSAPLVAGTAALMLSANPSLSPWQVRQLIQATARAFPTTGGDNGDGSIVPQCTLPQYDDAGDPVDQGQCYCTTYTCGGGMLDAAAAVAAAKNGVVLPAVQGQGLWWNMPAASENGWGINFAHQDSTIFATWFTYDELDNPWWLSMTASRIADNVYSGTLFETHGPAFSATPFNPALVTRSSVGQATIAFSNDSTATFSYTVNAITDTKVLTRQVFGPLPVCQAAQGNAATATNYQDLWWNPSESGWGVNLTQQGDVIFITWFTYDANGQPLWLSGTARRTDAQTYAGALVHTTGSSFDAVPYRTSDLTVGTVGTFTLTFADGNHAAFAYSYAGVSQTKQITRQVFSGAGTVCH
jgi:serine protease